MKELLCYTHVLGNKPGERIGIVKYNETGYWLTDFDEIISTKEQVDEKVQWLNERLGVPASVAESMTYASLFGWDAPIAERARQYYAFENYNCTACGVRLVARDNR